MVKRFTFFLPNSNLKYILCVEFFYKIVINSDACKKFVEIQISFFFQFGLFILLFY